jgi:hypothetical protein
MVACMEDFPALQPDGKKAVSKEKYLDAKALP